MNNKYRSLTIEEINLLEKNLCTCDDWSLICVDRNFIPTYIKQVRFSGKNYLGVFEDSFLLDNGITQHSGLFNVCLHNTTIGDNTYIQNIHSYISNYSIGAKCYIQNVDIIVAAKDAVFGNNVEIAVLDETGGRRVPLFDQLSSHLAYFIACYRYNTPLIKSLEQLIAKYQKSRIPTQGIIGDHVKICNAGEIKDVIIQSYTYIDGSAKVVNGTIISEENAPTYLGRSVIAEDFIATAGASIEDSVFLNNTFIGQAARLRRGFSATDSLFFSNCHFEHGESCAAFAGPYTVSHHKPTLLIGAMFSFMNAGSGTNQSNHLYKQGPIHQGITERGLKTSSNSYMMWPAHIGAFSFVNGKHYLHPDTSNFPYSYLVEENEATTLIPGLCLRNVSLMRDEQKWKARDKRKAKHHLDYIHTNVHSPYTMEKAFKAIGVLKMLLELPYAEKYNYKGCYIKRISLEKGIRLYNLAIEKYIGDIILGYFSKMSVSSWKEIENLFSRNTLDGAGAWVDVSGLLAPKCQIDNLTDKIICEEIADIQQIDSSLSDIYSKYDDYEFSWVVDKLLQHENGRAKSISRDQFLKMIDKWSNASVLLYTMMLDDLKKEYSRDLTVGFGVDSHENKEADIVAVRGRWEDNKMAKSIYSLINQVIEKTNHVKNMLSA